MENNFHLLCFVICSYLYMSKILKTNPCIKFVLKISLHLCRMQVEEVNTEQWW